MKLLLALTTFAFAITPVYAIPLNQSTAKSALHTISSRALNCTTDFQYFTIKHDYPSDTVVLYLESENFNVESTLASFKELANETTFNNHFTHPKQSILTGAVHTGMLTEEGEPIVKTLCALTFSCKYSKETGYNYHVTTNGVGCTIIDGGNGSKENPYVISLK